MLVAGPFARQQPQCQAATRVTAAVDSDNTKIGLGFRFIQKQVLVIREGIQVLDLPKVG